ncbi:MAG: Tex family protein [Gammaproteobacteria bacterium]
MNINQRLADELNVGLWQIEATIQLFGEGATVPFVARYRKEATGGLDDTQLRNLEERYTYLTELEERKQTIIKSIEEQGKLSNELRNAINETDNKARLEDLYLPYKPKRRTKGQIAKEAGLEPLADALYDNPGLSPIEAAQAYLNPDHKIETPEQALEGARHILMERFAENADLLEEIRSFVWAQGLLTSKVVKEKETEGVKFSDYFDYNEPIKKVPSHRALAVLRGQKENYLRVNIELAESDESVAIQKIAATFNIKNQNRAADGWLLQTVEWTWKIKLKLKIEVDLIIKLRESAELDAIKVFKDNLKNLLMAAPAGHRSVIGLDPGLRTGVKVVIIDETGKLLNHLTIFPHAPKNEWDESVEILAKIAATYRAELVSIGNGTASRETDQLVSDVIKRFPELKLTKIVVSEAGASVYSASQLAANEFPDLDVSYRGAVSIARRLQDPLAELVKIDPKAIGVGQYQHDVNQIKLGKGLEAVVEDCVNAVGADVNTASVPLLKSIAGLNETVAQNIVQYRETHGRFPNRKEIKKVPRLGEKTYQQAIGFLRIIGGENPLDASAVHPEAYPVVEQILEKSGHVLQSLMGNAQAINTLDPKEFVNDVIGLPTIQDILTELNKPGRDPRPEFKMVTFKEGVETLADLKPGMALEGVITNVTNFGAFVDIGVHQDGLVHISQMAEKFVSDPHQVVKVGQIVKVKVLDIDLPRKRIQLTMRMSDTARTQQQPKPEQRTQPSSQMKQKQHSKPKLETITNNLLSDALSKAFKQKS